MSGVALCLTAWLGCRAPGPSEVPEPVRDPASSEAPEPACYPGPFKASEPACYPAVEQQDPGPIVHMDIGELRSCAAHQSGAVTCRGGKQPPVVFHGLGDAVEVAARDDQPCVRTRDGEVWCWWFESADTPPARLDDRTDAVQIADNRLTGELFVVRRDGSVTRHPHEGPTTVVAGIVDAVGVASGHSLVCFLRENGGASCIDELLGKPLVARVIPDARDLVSLTVGSAQVCGVTASGEARCWQWGIDGFAFGARPIPMLAPIARMAAGNGFACGLNSDGVACWGRVPWPIGPTVAGLADVEELFAGPRQLCARTKAGAVWCLGEDSHGQLGDGISASGFGVNRFLSLRALAAARGVTCAAAEGGVLHCWGTAEGWTRPVQVGRIVEAARMVVSEAAVCVHTAKAVRCRRLPSVDAGGALSIDMTWRALPASADTIDVDLQNTTVCALRKEGMVDCWDLDAASAAARPAGSVDGAVALALATDGEQIYVRTAAGAVRCLGPAGECVPTTSLRDVVELAAGARHLCVLTGGGVVHCVGSGGEGQLGGVPLGLGERVTLAGRYLAIDAFHDRTCAITELERVVECWGSWGRKRSSTPQEIAGFTRAGGAIAVGERHVCIGLEDGTVECLGKNQRGELGNGRAALVPRPRRLPWR